MKQPTEVQIKEFWTKCGLVEQHTGSWYVNEIGGEFVRQETPPIDLNNLFKYAWDKAVERLADIDLSTNYEARCKLLMLWAERGRSALTLFWVLQEGK